MPLRIVRNEGLPDGGTPPTCKAERLGSGKWLVPTCSVESSDPVKDGKTQRRNVRYLVYRHDENPNWPVLEDIHGEPLDTSHVWRIN